MKLYPILVSLFAITFLFTACQNPGGSNFSHSDYFGNGSYGYGSGYNSGGGSSSGSNYTGSTGSSQNSGNQSAEEQRCQRISSVTDAVQWNCHELFASPDVEISSTCRTAWDNLYRAGYCDLTTVNRTISACSSDISRGWSVVPNACKQALAPFQR